MRIGFLFFAAVVVLGCASLTKAQYKSSELSEIEDRLIRSVEQELSGWKHTSISPMEGSSDVVIDQWSDDNKSARVTIIRHPSDEEAQRKLRSLTTTLKAAKTITDSGDEQYSMPTTSGSVVYQKHRFTIHIDVRSTDPDEQKTVIKQLSRLASRAITKN